MYDTKVIMKKNEIEFSTFDIAKKFGIPRSNLQQYMDRGFIEPSIQKAKRKGDKNKFSLEDLYRLRLFKELHRVGLSQKDAAFESRAVDFDTVIAKRGWLLIKSEKGEINHTYTNAKNGFLYLGHRFKADSFVVINLNKIVEDTNAIVRGKN